MSSEAVQDAAAPQPSDDRAVLDLFRLDDRVAIVTGASAGLGVVFAQALAEAGADVVVAARRKAKLDRTRELVEQVGRRCLAVQADVASSQDCRTVVEEAMTHFGRVDILVNNAAVGPVRPASKEREDEFRQVIDINLNGSYWMAQACGKVMEHGSSIINISSMLGINTLVGFPVAAYAASKAGVIGLTRELAQQWTGRKGIRVNAVAPGFFASEMTERFTDTFADVLESRLLVGRPGDPRELAATVVWLASDAGGYVTGQTIVVDGGVTIT